MKKIYIISIKKIKKMLVSSNLFPKILTKSRNNQHLRWLVSLFEIHELNFMISEDLPWWPYKVSNKIDKIINKNSSVFEFGSGSSTLWLAKRSLKVTSVEHERNWANQIIELLPKNCNLITKSPVKNVETIEKFESKKSGYKNLSFEEYVKTIETQEEKYDLIVIDGRARNACLKVSLKYLKPNGFILFDNANRLRYLKTLKKLPPDYSVNFIFGLVPTLPIPSCSALIQRKFKK